MTGRIMPIHLGVDSLWNRYGFCDGDPFEFEDPGQDHDDDPPHPDWDTIQQAMTRSQRDDLLELLVVRHLLPVAQAAGHTIRIVRIGTHHNPLQDARFRDGMRIEDMNGLEDIGVEVSREEIMRAAAEVLGRSRTTMDGSRS